MLSENLKILLATSYAFVIKAQNFHWNIEGSKFPHYHKFFDELNIKSMKTQLIELLNTFVH